ncbi:MAG TPA: AI-2E family transporter [Polyangia bacterium]|nr:AI-2E family transporter [Polyangia bacterium]
MVAAVVMAVSHALVAVTLTTAALLLAIALNHVVAMLIKRSVPRVAAIAIVTVGLLGLQTGLGFTIIPPAIKQGKALVQQAPGYVRSLRNNRLFKLADQRLDLSSKIPSFEQKVPDVLEGAAAPVLSALGGILSVVAAAVTVFFLTVFMLIFGAQLVRGALAEARPERAAMYRSLIDKIYLSVGGYVGGLVLICSINGTLTTIFLAVNSVPFFLPLGILSGLSSTIPYAGPFVAGTLITLISLITQGWWHALACIIYFIAYGQLEGNVLSPLIFRRTVHVNPLIVTLSVLFLGEIGGVVGAVVAVPAVAALEIVVREVLRRRRQQLALARDAGEDLG